VDVGEVFSALHGKSKRELRHFKRSFTGEVTVVVWNEKVEEIERALRVSARLLLVNARVKEAKNGAVEVHVDSSTFVDAQTVTAI